MVDMALPLLALLTFDAINHAHGHVYKPSKQTSAAENTPDGVNGWSPKPTHPPRFGGPARHGAMTLHELFKRSSAADIATCGWINRDGNDPLTCAPGYACAYYTSPAPQWFACCTVSNGEIDWDVCPYYSTCYPYDTLSAPNTWTGSVEYAPSGFNSILCASAQPYCNTWAYTDTSGSTYQNLYCDTTQAIYDVYGYVASSSAAATTSSSQQGGGSSTSSSPYVATTSSPYSSSSTPAPSTPVTTSQAGGTTTSPRISFSPASQTSSTASPTAAGGGGSKSNTGAIAGGVVGGVAGIALLGAAIGYLVYRKRKARVEPMREVSIYSNNYSSPGYSNNGYTNPNTSYNGNYGNNY